MPVASHSEGGMGVGVGRGVGVGGRITVNVAEAQRGGCGAMMT